MEASGEKASTIDIHSEAFHWISALLRKKLATDFTDYTKVFVKSVESVASFFAPTLRGSVPSW
jgi:hypothetical protein